MHGTCEMFHWANLQEGYLLPNESYAGLINFSNRALSLNCSYVSISNDVYGRMVNGFKMLTRHKNGKLVIVGVFKTYHFSGTRIPSVHYSRYHSKSLC